MDKKSSKENFYIGLALSNSSNYDSSIAVVDRAGNIVYLDKFYYTQDLEMFFQNSPYLFNSICCVSVPYDNSMLDGKWRIHSKNYKPLAGKMDVNRNNWTKRLSNRLCATLLNYRADGGNIFRCDVNQLRQAFGLAPHYLMRSSIDCKNLQNSLKLKFNYTQLPDNILSASSLEALICATFAQYIAQGGETNKLYDFEGIEVLAKPFD